MSDEQPKIYTVRFSRDAEQSAILAGHARFELDGNVQAGLELIDAIYAEAVGLRILPHRFPRAPHESEVLGLPLRRRNIEKWAMFYTIEEESDDGPLVTVVFLWPGSAESITSDQADRVRLNQ
jgi:hypothetical protein